MMKHPTLRLYTDRLPAGATAALPAGINRAIYIAEGAARAVTAEAIAALGVNSVWHGNGAVVLEASAAGARLLRWELVDAGRAPAGVLGGTGIESTLTLEAALPIDPAARHLLRCDRVDFPPGGIAYTHVHQGPGMRCLQSGSIRIETQGKVHDYTPGQAWFETGPDPVRAPASKTESSHFIRVMILPQALKGKSSLRYVLPEDADKPKTQKYQVFIDAPIDLD